MRFIAWIVICLSRFPSGGGIPGYWAWFIGMIGIAIGILNTEWAKVFSYASEGELAKAAMMAAVPLIALAFVLIGYIIFNARGGAQFLKSTESAAHTQETGESAEVENSEPPA